MRPAEERCSFPFVIDFIFAFWREEKRERQGARGFQGRVGSEERKRKRNRRRRRERAIESWIGRDREQDYSTRNGDREVGKVR